MISEKRFQRVIDNIYEADHTLFNYTNRRFRNLERTVFYLILAVGFLGALEVYRWIF